MSLSEARLPSLRRHSSSRLRRVSKLGGRCTDDVDKGLKTSEPNEQMQRDADKGIKTRNSGESGYVADQDKPGALADPPGRPENEQTTGSTSPTVARERQVPVALLLETVGYCRSECSSELPLLLRNARARGMERFPWCGGCHTASAALRGAGLTRRNSQCSYSLFVPQLEPKEGFPL